MPRYPRPRPPETLPPDILPPDFVTRHDLLRRLHIGPTLGLTAPHAWAPMTDAEWEVLRHLLPGTPRGGPGRPIGHGGARARLDAVFRAVTLKRPTKGGSGRAPWSDLPPGFGRPDTVARTFRRWARAGLWTRLLGLVADRDGRPPESLLLGLRWRACCAFRRAWRLLGMAGILLARRLGLHSVLPAPSHCLPDPDLSAIYGGVIDRTLNRLLAGLRVGPDGRACGVGWRPPRRAWAVFRSMLRIAGGRTRLARALEPP